MQNRTTFQNFQFKLGFIFGAWLVGLVLIPVVYLAWQHHQNNRYASTSAAVHVQACVFWDGIGKTDIPIFNLCKPIATAARGHAGAAADSAVLSSTPLYSALLAFFVGVLLFGAGQKKVRGAVRDVEEDTEALKKLAKPFDPLKYIGKGKGIFVGLDENRNPLYWLRKVLDKNHIEILGESGVGKSSLAGVLLGQLAASGEAVVVFDPKNDRNLPGVLAEAGRTWGDFPVYVLDLRPVADFPQVNPFKGCRPDQIEELLQVALELGKNGDAKVDFHRGGDREAVGDLSEVFAAGQANISYIIAASAEDSHVTSQVNLWRELRQLGRVRALHTADGLDLAKVLANEGVLYVIGSTTKLEVVAAQRLILQRILQILDERTDQKRPVALFLDELKYILSPAALRAAGTIRDRNCHLIFAHQSLGDLDDCAGLNPKAVRGAIWGNSGIKICYKMLDSQTACELESIAGQSAIEAESKGKSGHGDTSTKKMEKAQFMPAHVFTHLPKPTDGEASVGVVFGLGTAFYLSTQWLKAGAAPQPVAAEPIAQTQQARRDDLSDLIQGEENGDH